MKKEYEIKVKKSDIENKCLTIFFFLFISNKDIKTNCINVKNERTLSIE